MQEQQKLARSRQQQQLRSESVFVSFATSTLLIFLDASILSL